MAPLPMSKPDGSTFAKYEFLMAAIGSVAGPCFVVGVVGEA